MLKWMCEERYSKNYYTACWEDLGTCSDINCVLRRSWDVLWFKVNEIACWWTNVKEFLIINVYNVLRTGWEMIVSMCYDTMLVRLWSDRLMWKSLVTLKVAVVEIYCAVSRQGQRVVSWDCGWFRTLNIVWILS